IDICIEDNGVGIKENTTSTKELGGVGIKNIQERLALFFGEAFSMEIESEPNAYTKVYLHLPLKEEGHANS
ncbi:MAG: sensor histidine kinase, partial [Streptococcus sp.]|nr:sensor histidine kinase [Streptococcus sp.]